MALVVKPKNRRRRICTIFEPCSGIRKIREPSMVRTSVLYNGAWDDQLAEKCHTVKYLRRFFIRTILERHWQDLRASTPAADGSLPSISYVTGGLEDAGIRKVVCDILEGGEKAFTERARRLRVKLLR